MVNQQHLAMLKLSIEDWNEWRQVHHEILPDLSGADLKGAQLQRIDLSRARLNNADLTEANLMEAML
ncbi:MAG: pentapeptide repeat-containing protein, partial [Ktedonobacteraceae bacterium]|nr:pentapeptide repeat-containing protein [Ktedonobacteraceae bacterium]